MKGFEDNTFRGERAVTGYELVSLAARALRNEGTAEETEADAGISLENVPDWAYDDVTYAAEQGIISESEKTVLSDEAVSRGEASVILYRLYERL